MYISAQLPISLNPERSFDYDSVRAFGHALLSTYRNSNPFPHLVVDDCLSESVIRKVCASFPSKGELEQCFEQGYLGYRTRCASPYMCDSYISRFFYSLNSAPMLQFLESLTGIKGLIPDPYFSNGGLIETRSGGFVEPQSNIGVHEILNLQPRVNMIIYLNEDWRDEYGGDLEMWGSGLSRCVKRISPSYNRCVIFNSEKNSYHGHPQALQTPLDVSRRSILVSYYTSEVGANDYVRTPLGFRSKNWFNIMSYFRRFTGGI